MNETNLVQSVDRALRIIEFLAENPTGAGITEISKSLGLRKGISLTNLVILNCID